MLRTHGLVCLLVLSCGCHVSPRFEATPATPASPDANSAVADAAGAGREPDARVFALDAGPDAATDAGNVDGVRDDAAPDAAFNDAANPAEALPSNVSFETARNVQLGAIDVWQTLHSDQQVDYYAFDAPAAGFYALSTNRGSFSPDNVMTLYDSERHAIAENDDGALWPGDAIDARLVVRLPVAGRYFVRIEDRTTPAEFFDGGFGPSLYYQLSIRAVDGNTPGFALENANDAQPTQISFLMDERSGNVYVTLLGSLSTDDNDVFALAGRTDSALIGDLLLPGPTGDGSTALLGRVRVVNAEQHALGRIDRAVGQHAIHPPVGDGAYQLVVSADGQPGNNAFYALNLSLLSDNPREQHSDSNGVLAMAEPLVLKGSGNRRGLVLASLPPGDVDYFSFDVYETEQLFISCESESGGSGVHALRVEVRDARDHVLAFAIEEPAKNLFIEQLSVPSAGTHFLRLSSEAVAKTDMVEPWARCVVITSPSELP